MSFSVYFAVSLCVNIFFSIISVFITWRSLSGARHKVVTVGAPVGSYTAAFAPVPKSQHLLDHCGFTMCLWVYNSSDSWTVNTPNTHNSAINTDFQGFCSDQLCVYEDLPILHIAEHSLKLRTISRLASRTYHLNGVRVREKLFYGM